MPVKEISQLQQRSKPAQKRSEIRSDVILKTTGELLEKVGVEHLTTTMIAQQCGISVGALYHYFPNKHAILYLMAKNWLDDALSVLHEIQTLDFSNLSIDKFVEFIMDRELIKYQHQQGLMPLIHAMHVIPELRDLSDEHDELCTQIFYHCFKSLNLIANDNELYRIATCFYEFTYPLLLLSSQQTNYEQTQAVMDDLKFLSAQYLKRYVK